MSSLFIIGNGFDIAHGIPTKYSDFREFILKMYPKAEKNSIKVVSLEYLNRKHRKKYCWINFNINFFPADKEILEKIEKQ